jgi:hypothetical protein
MRENNSQQKWQKKTDFCQEMERTTFTRPVDSAAS